MLTLNPTKGLILGALEFSRPPLTPVTRGRPPGHLRVYDFGGLLALLTHGEFGVFGMTLLQCAFVIGTLLASTAIGEKLRKY